MNSFGPVLLICKYIIMQGSVFLSVSMAINDPDTNIRSESLHHLFTFESQCFDIWFDPSQAIDEDHDAILKQMLKTD